MDGSERTVLSNSTLIQPNGIVVDISEGRVYWLDAIMDVIEYINVDGTGFARLETEDNGLDIPFALAVVGNLLYWTDRGLSSISVRHKINSNSTVIITVDTTTSTPGGIISIAPGIQPQRKRDK